MNDQASAVTLPDSLPCIAVFGLDESRKAHASVFAKSDAELAQRAASLMGLHVLLLDGPEHHIAAQKLPKGRVFASGKAFVPFVKRALYDELCGFGGVNPNEVVLPQREANNADAAKDVSKTAPLIQNYPEDWTRIRPGSVVLAIDQPEDGWCDAVVTETQSDGLHILIWRDYSDYLRISEHHGHGFHGIMGSDFTASRAPVLGR